MKGIPIRRWSRAQCEEPSELPKPADTEATEVEKLSSASFEYPVGETAGQPEVDEDKATMEVPEPVASVESAISPALEDGDSEYSAIATEIQDSLQAVLDRLDTVGARFAAIEESLIRGEDSNRAAVTNAALIQSQSRQIRELQDGESQHQVVLPLLQVFVEAIDTIDSERGNIPVDATAEEYERRYREFLSYLDEHLTSALKRHGMTPMYQAKPGTPFDPATQRVVSVRTVSAPANGIVIAAPRRGYMFDGKVQRPQEVVVQKTTQEDAK